MNGTDPTGKIRQIPFQDDVLKDFPLPSPDDVDGDEIPNRNDEDNDDDGLGDSCDPFPFDPNLPFETLPPLEIIDLTPAPLPELSDEEREQMQFFLDLLEILLRQMVPPRPGEFPFALNEGARSNRLIN